MHLLGSRHPVIEQRLPKNKARMANICFEQQIIVITGPNVAGKSALLRQVALTVLMVQMGCFVLAASAQIAVVDKRLAKVGTSDNFVQGESIFMMEMAETTSIMRYLSDHSLVQMDEIGRGTSTYDGIFIALALVEYFQNHPHCKAKTLFSANYHEFNELAKKLLRIKTLR